MPPEIQRDLYDAYRQFQRDPYYPGLQFKRDNVRENIYSVRIGDNYRALGRRINADLIVWFWIGTHSEYDKLLKQR
ncbi:MAG: ParE family toxin-like protein [Aggregatilineales bacterium]